MTFSIVARCPRTGQYGACIATYSPNVGPRCVSIVPGRGAASVQATGSPVLNMLAAEMLARGIGAKKIVAELLESDPLPEKRQITVVDVYGMVCAHSGTQIPEHAGHRTGAGYACAGNVLVGEGVVDAMALAFEACPDEPLAERLMRSVEAGRDAGGQPEGQYSSALYLYDRIPVPVVDLRVEVHDEPVAELRRIWDWYRPMIPYYGSYVARALDGTLERWWQWRQKNDPGWTPRHLR